MSMIYNDIQLPFQGCNDYKVESKPSYEPVISDHKCLSCGEVLHRRSYAKYCNEICQRKYEKIHYKKIHQTCIVCGEDFIKNQWKTFKTCSRSCGAKLRNMR